MNSFPKIPLDILFYDSLKGKNKQLYIDSEGNHQYYKELDFIKKVQSFVKDRQDTARRADVNYCRVKFADTMHKLCLKEFGYSLHITDWSVREHIK